MRPAGRPARGAESPGIPGYIDLQGAPQRGSNRCVARCPINVPRHAQTPLDEATQMRHAKRPDHYLCDAAEQQFTHLSSLGVKWSQVQILSARRRKPAPTSVGAGFVVLRRSSAPAGSIGSGGSRKPRRDFGLPVMDSRPRRGLTVRCQLSGWVPVNVATLTDQMMLATRPLSQEN